nr:hypothetical protein [Tanacetum cinerariifolium]
MIAIVEKYEHNIDFHQIVDFVEASHIRIETTDKGTKILATVDGKLRTISESSIRRNLKLNDEEGIITLPNAELFENLALMGYNILPNQSNIATAVPYHTPSPEAQQSLQHDLSSSIHPPVTTKTIPTIIPTDIPTLRQYSKRARIAQSSALPTAADEPTSPFGDDTNILTSGVQVVSVPPAAEVSIVSVPTSSGLVPTASPIFTTASVVTPYSRRKGKEKMVESNMPKKKKLQEQIDVHIAREIEEQLAREDQRRDEQIARDAEIPRIHAKEELQMLIDSLDRSNKMIAKYLQEYEQFAEDLSIREKIDIINELVKYQDHYAKVLKYKSQQRKPLSKKQQREFYMSVLKSHSGWKTKHFKGMSLEEIKEKFIPVWKQIEDFVPMASKEEGERVKRKGLRLEQESAKKVKTSEEISEEDLKEMMHLVPVEEVYVEALQHLDKEDLNQLWTLVKETFSIRQATSDKEKELWVELKRLYEPDVEDRLSIRLQTVQDKKMIEGILSRSSFDFGNLIADGASSLGERDVPAEEVRTADKDKE